MFPLVMYKWSKKLEAHPRIIWLCHGESDSFGLKSPGQCWRDVYALARDGYLQTTHDIIRSCAELNMKGGSQTASGRGADENFGKKFPCLIQDWTVSFSVVYVTFCVKSGVSCHFLSSLGAHLNVQRYQNLALKMCIPAKSSISINVHELYYSISSTFHLTEWVQSQHGHSPNAKKCVPATNVRVK